jgi:hypothetical protein
MPPRFESKKFHSIEQTELQNQTQNEYLIILGLIEGIITSRRAQARRKPSHLLLFGIRCPFLITGVRLLARSCSIPFEPREILIAPLYHPPEGIFIKVRTLHSTERTREYLVRDDGVVLHLLRTRYICTHVYTYICIYV